MKSGMFSRITIAAIGILLAFGCVTPKMVRADIAPAIRYESDPFFKNIEEIAYVAHTFLDIKNLQEMEDIQDKNASLRNESFREALSVALRNGLSKEVQEEIKINDLKPKRYPRSSVYTTKQILVEVTYTFGREIINSQPYVVGAVYGNVWRLPEGKCVGVDQSGYHGTLTGVQPVAYFLFREDDANSPNEIRLAVEKAISGIVKSINYYANDIRAEKNGEFHNGQEE